MLSKIVPLLGNYTKDNSQIPLGIVCNFINFILKKAKFPSTIVMCDLFTSLGHFTASFKMSFYISSTEEMLFTVGKHVMTKPSMQLMQQLQYKKRLA